MSNISPLVRNVFSYPCTLGRASEITVRNVMQQIITTFNLVIHSVSHHMHFLLLARDSTFLRTQFCSSSVCLLVYGRPKWVSDGVCTTFNGVSFPHFIYIFLLLFVTRTAFSCVSDTLTQRQRHWWCFAGKIRRKFQNKIAWCKTISATHCTHREQAWTRSI